MREAIASILLSRIVAEEKSGFARLHRIPSSERFHFLDYYNSIPEDERLALHKANALVGAHWFESQPSQAAGTPRPAALEKYLAKRGWFNNWRYWGYRELRMMRSGLKQDPNHSLVKDLPPEALAKVQAVETAKAVDLRKVAKLAFGQLLGAKPENRGIWAYAGKIEGEKVSVHLDYGSKSYQLRYDVQLSRLKPWQTFKGPAYENLLGFGSGGWNQIEAGSEDQAFALLTELVHEVFDISMTVYEQVLKNTE